jgi:hypothetical protein
MICKNCKNEATEVQCYDCGLIGCELCFIKIIVESDVDRLMSTIFHNCDEISSVEFYLCYNCNKKR